MAKVKVIMLASDEYSPMSSPHGLPALRWPGLARETLDAHGPEGVEKRLQNGGWDPQWRFGMYEQAHYHTTTHELLVVIEGHATIQLGGTDERARPKNASKVQSTEQIEMQLGDVLLLPAGYSHRSLESHAGFTMIGSYPAGAERWDMRFPNAMGCPHDSKKIGSLVEKAARKGLFHAQSPDRLVGEQDVGQAQPSGDVESHWQL